MDKQKKFIVYYENGEKLEVLRELNSIPDYVMFTKLSSALDFINSNFK